MNIPSLSLTLVAPKTTSSQTTTPAQPIASALTPMLQSPNQPSMLSKAASVSLGAGLNITKRLYNGVADVVKMFLPPQLGKTIKHTLLWTAGLSAFSFVLTGPFHLPALPAFALASLGFDMAWTFVGGLMRSPNNAYAQLAPMPETPLPTAAPPQKASRFNLGLFNPFSLAKPLAPKPNQAALTEPIPAQ